MVEDCVISRYNHTARGDYNEAPCIGGGGGGSGYLVSL